MSGAASARDTVRKLLVELYRPVHAAGKAYVDAHQKAITADDLVEVLGHTVDLILAAEHLEKIADEAAKAARASLAATMEATGATQIASGPVTAHIARKGVYVKLDDGANIPEQYMTHPAPTPDKAALRKALEAGEHLPGISLVRPNDFQLAIRSNSK
jgi:hypothetical protein